MPHPVSFATTSRPHHPSISTNAHDIGRSVPRARICSNCHRAFPTRYITMRAFYFCLLGLAASSCDVSPSSLSDSRRAARLLTQSPEPLAPASTTSPLAPLPKWTTRRGGLQNPFRKHKQTAPPVESTTSNKAPAVTKIDPAVAYSTAVRRTMLAVGAACAFGFGLWYIEGKKSAMEFFAGYLIEESLSVDNIFVFIMLFEYFKVPFEYQSRALTWGIVGAVAMRGVMISVGVAAIQRFRWVVLMFAGILLGSAFKLLAETGHEGGEEDLSDNLMLRVAKKCVNAVDEYDGNKFFTKRNGKRFATPLFMCLICIELSDFVFAVDSIPAVLGVSKDPLIVYSSNIFAIMALRSLYTLVATAVNTLEYIKPSVALVLAFVGGKMIAEFFHVEVPISVSLLVVMSLLGGGIGLSVLKQRFTARNAETKR